MTRPACTHDDASSTRVGTDTVASAWECDHCGHLTPFTDEDYVFCNSRPWTPARPVGVTDLQWLFTSRESKFAHYAGESWVALPLDLV